MIMTMTITTIIINVIAITISTTSSSPTTSSSNEQSHKRHAPFMALWQSMEIREIQRPLRGTETFSLGEFHRDKNQWEVTVCHNWRGRINQSVNGKRRYCGTRVVSGQIDQFELTCAICRLANPASQTWQTVTAQRHISSKKYLFVLLIQISRLYCQFSISLAGNAYVRGQQWVVFRYFFTFIDILLSVAVEGGRANCYLKRKTQTRLSEDSLY